MKWTKSLLEIRKGRHLQASGSWQATKQEDLIIKAVGLWFTVSVLATLTASFFQIKAILAPSIISLALSFIGMFVAMFGIVFLKARKEPMETHYYADDYYHNAFSGKTVDNSREISAEEFLGKDSADHPLDDSQP